MPRSPAVSDKEWMAIYRRLAKDGDAEAAHALSLWTRQGRATPKDPARADRWLRQAAATLPAAQLTMGQQARDVVDASPAAQMREARTWLRRAAKAGIAEAWHDLGLTWLESPRTPRRVAMARRMLERSLRLGYGYAGRSLAMDVETLGGDLVEVERWLERAVVLDEDESWSLGMLTFVRTAKPFLDRLEGHSIATWRLLAEAGDLDAQTCLGYACRFGRGVPCDVSVAEAWFERAARGGGRDARLALALLVWDFTSGIGFDRAAFWAALAAKGGGPVENFVAGWLDRYNTDAFRRAVRWWRVAAQQGHADAAHWFGRCLRFGTGVRKDPASAVHWLRIAAERGVPVAQAWLAEILDEGELVRRDRRRATKWLRAAASAGNVDAQLKLGVRLHEGCGVRRDDRECARWYRRAATSGEKHATSNLGLCCRNGHGVRRHDGRSSVLFRRAAEIGNNGRAAWQLSHAFDGRAGRADDPALEIHWLRRGAALMEPEALSLLGVLYHNGKRVPRDRPFAVTLYRASSALGNSWATYLLGLCYRDGEGVAKDRRRAFAWFRKAARLGVRQAVRAEAAMRRKPARSRAAKRRSTRPRRGRGMD